MHSKYSRIAHSCEDIMFYNYETLLEDDEIQKAMSDLRDDGIIKSYGIEDWKRLYELSITKDATPLKIAIMKSKYVPPYYINKIISTLDHDERYFAFASDRISTGTLLSLKDMYSTTELYSIISQYGDSFSSKSIDFLCEELTEKEQKELHYMPFCLIRDGCEVIDRLETILANEDGLFFENDVPEKLATMIATNRKIPESIRNMAFDIGYNISDLNSMTDKMIEEVYQSCAETIFMPNDGVSSTKTMKRIAHNELSTMVQANFLKESHQLDYIQQTRHSTMSSNETLAVLLRNSEYPDVLKLATYIPDAKVIENIADNEFGLNCDVVKEALKTRPAKQLNLMYVSAVFRSPTDRTLLSPFMPLNDISIFRAIMASCKTPEVVCDSIVDHTKHLKQSEELHFLRDLRKVVVDKITEPNNQKIMNFVTSLFFKNDIDFKDVNTFASRDTTAHRLIKEIKSGCLTQWFLFSKKELNSLIPNIEKLSEKYPRFQKTICKPLLEQIYFTIKDSIIVQKYPEVFVVNHEDLFKKEISRIPFTSINLKPLYSMSDKEMTQFINDVKEYANPATVDSLFSQIYTEMDIPYIDGDKLYHTLNTFANLYEKLDNILNPPSRKWKIEDIEDIEF